MDILYRARKAKRLVILCHYVTIPARSQQGPGGTGGQRDPLLRDR